jgi:membrane-associated protein
MIGMLLALLPSWLDPQTIIGKGGLWLVGAIIFAESGLLIGFFLPGDSLLFIAGFLASKPEGLPHLNQPLWLVLIVVYVAAVAGDQVGYIFGRAVGPSLFHRPKSRLFNPDNVTRAHVFFDRHGPKTIVLARFVPIVRTFAPIVAGVANMKYRTFTIYNLVGAGIWAVGVTTLGYYMGQIDIVREHVELAAILIVALSLIPVAIEFVKHRKHAKEPAHEQVG